MSASDHFPLLFSPAEVAGLSLRNRVVMPPINTAMQVGSDQFEAWYETRARGGVGLIIMEALWVDRLLDDDYCAKLEPAVGAIKGEGVPVVLQLFQPPQAPNGDPFAPSETEDARAATEDELSAIPGRFAEAAARCRELGFDGVEPHGAHGFFLNRAFSPAHNRRTDRFGGSPENRMTLALEIVAAIRREVGAGYPIFYRHTAEEGDAYTVADSIPFVGKLVEAGVDVLDISPSSRSIPPRGFHKENLEATGAAEADAPGSCSEHADIAGEVRAALDAPVIAVGGMEVAELAEAALRDGKCDLCAVGRQLIADPDWPTKAREGRMDEVIQCTKCDSKCFGNLAQGVPIGCVENPRSGNEHKLV